MVSGEVSDAEKGMEWWHQAEAGGGALLDYCCYGACLASWLLPNPPDTVQCLEANLMSGFGTADDNAAMLLRFPSAIAILEASWTTFHSGVAQRADPLRHEGNDRRRRGGHPGLSRPRREGAERGGEGRSPAAGPRHDRGGIPPPSRDWRSPASDARLPINLATMAILDAGMQSAENGAAASVERVR